MKEDRLAAIEEDARYGASADLDTTLALVSRIRQLETELAQIKGGVA